MFYGPVPGPRPEVGASYRRRNESSMPPRPPRRSRARSRLLLRVEPLEGRRLPAAPVVPMPPPPAAWESPPPAVTAPGAEQPAMAPGPAGGGTATDGGGWAEPTDPRVGL